MLHLSLLHLPRDHPRWRQLSPYQAHQLTWKAFPGVARGERPFLFSLDPRGAHHSLLVQSTCAADWAFLNDDATVNTKAFDPGHIQVGAPLRFFLRANPTVDRQGYADGKKRRVAVGIGPERVFRQMGRPGDAPATPVERARWRDEQLRNWLTRQGERSGFTIDSCEPGPITARRIVKSDNGRPQGRPMTIHEVEFSGTLRPSDSVRFVQALAEGIGRGKAFGYGLLMVRPA